MMSSTFKPISRLALATFIFGGGGVLWVLGQGPALITAGAQAQAQSYFMGGNPSRVDTKMTMAALKFPKGSRSNWSALEWSNSPASRSAACPASSWLTMNA